MLRKLTNYEDYIGHQVWCRDRARAAVFSARIVRCDVCYRLRGGGADSAVTAVVIRDKDWPLRPEDVFESELEAYEDLQRSIEDDLAMLKDISAWSSGYGKSLEKQLKIVRKRISKIKKEN